MCRPSCTPTRRQKRQACAPRRTPRAPSPGCGATASARASRSPGPARRARSSPPCDPQQLSGFSLLPPCGHRCSLHMRANAVPRHPTALTAEMTSAARSACAALANSLCAAASGCKELRRPKGGVWRGRAPEGGPLRLRVEVLVGQALAVAAVADHDVHRPALVALPPAGHNVPLLGSLRHYACVQAQQRLQPRKVDAHDFCNTLKAKYSTSVLSGRWQHCEGL